MNNVELMRCLKVTETDGVYCSVAVRFILGGSFPLAAAVAAAAAVDDDAIMMHTQLM